MRGEDKTGIEHVEQKGTGSFLAKHAKAFDKYHQDNFGYIKDIEDLFNKIPVNKALSLYAHNAVKGAIISNLTIRANKVRVLDVGCGYGFLFQRLKARYPERIRLEMYGTDISSFAIENARRNIPEAVFYVCPAESLPFDDGFFENVVCSEVIEHVMDPAKVVHEMERVTASGGTLILSTPNYSGYLWSILRLVRKGQGIPLLRRLRAFLQKYSDFTVKDEHIPLSKLKVLLKENNLDLVKVIYLVPLPEQNLVLPNHATFWRFLLKATGFLEKLPFANKYLCAQLVIVAQKP